MSESKNPYWRAIELLFEAVDTSDEDVFFASIAPLDRSCVLLYAAHLCLAEVHNGGFLQFFWNSTGILTPEAIEGFKMIGMPELAEILEDAASPLGSPYPRNRDARWDALLIASNLPKNEIQEIFAKAPNLYLAFFEATKTVQWNVLEEQVWEVAETENGGFQIAADSYAVGLEPSRYN